MDLLMEQFEVESILYKTEETSDSDSQGEAENDEYKKEKKIHARRSLTDPFLNPYYITLVNSYSFEWARFEYKIYHDDYPLLKFRKFIVFIGSMISVACAKFYN